MSKTNYLQAVISDLQRTAGPYRCAISRLFAIDGIPNCACHQAPIPALLLRGWEPNDAATLWELQIASDAMSLDA